MNATSTQDIADTAGAGRESVDDFEPFFLTNYASVGRMLLTITGDRRRAEDLAQEAFVRVLARWDRVREMDSPEGYVYRVALNLGRAPESAVHLVPLDGTAEQAGDDETERVEIAVEVRRALLALPIEQREALALVDLLGMDSRAAAHILGIRPSSVRGRLHRARKTLRTMLADQRADGGDVP